MSKGGITLTLSSAQAGAVLAMMGAGYSEGYRLGLTELRPVLRVLAMACSRAARRDAAVFLREVAGPDDTAEKSTQ